MVTAASNISHTTTLLPESLENESTVTDWRNNHTSEAFVTDELPYVIGGVTVVCIVIAVAVAVILWKKARPWRQTRWDVESGSDQCAAVRLKVIQRNKEAPHVAKNQRQKRPDPDTIHPSGTSGPGSSPSGSRPFGDIHPLPADPAPDIIRAHDSDSLHDTVNERQSARAMPTHALPGNNQSYVSNGGGVAPDVNRCVSTAAHDSRYDHLVKNQRAPQKPPRQSGETDLRNLADPPPPVPPKPRTVRRPDGSLRVVDTADGREEVHALNDDLDTRGLHVLSPADSLKTALEKLTLQTYASERGALVCQLTVVGVRGESGETMTVPECDNSAFFLLQPLSTTCERENGANTATASSSQHHVKGQMLHESKDSSTRQASKQQYFILEPENHQGELPPQKTASPPNPPPPGSNMPGMFAPHYCSRRRFSLQNHQPDCPRNVARRFSEYAGTLHECRNSDMSSLPTLPSAEDLFLSDRRTDYTRSLSSPQSSHNRADLPGAQSSEKKLDAAALKARIQQEMRALGFVDERSLPEPEVTAAERTRAEPRLKFAVQDDAAVPGDAGRPSQHEYFILEPESDVSEHDVDGPDSAFDPVVRSCEAVTPPVSRRGMNPTDADAGGKMRYHRKLSATGLPPRVPQRPPRVVGHARSRSETPLFQMSEARGGEEGEEEQGPVIVSLKKFRSSTTVRRPAPLPADPPQEASRRPSFRPRISSEPGCS